jgi:hypothetical protein
VNIFIDLFPQPSAQRTARNVFVERLNEPCLPLYLIKRYTRHDGTHGAGIPALQLTAIDLYYFFSCH